MGSLESGIVFSVESILFLLDLSTSSLHSQIDLNIVSVIKLQHLYLGIINILPFIRTPLLQLLLLEKIFLNTSNC